MCLYIIVVDVRNVSSANYHLFIYFLATSSHSVLHF